MFHIIKPGTQFDFVGKRHIWLSISGLAVLSTIVLFFVKGLNYGIDFTGGAEVQIKVPQEWGITVLREKLTEGGLKGIRVQQIGEPGKNEFLIRAQGDEKSLGKISGQVESVLEKGFPGGGYEVLRADVVGPAAGELLRKQGALAMFYALMVILIYVAIRFDSRYAPGAVLALFHDSMIVLGIFILTQRQFDLTILAAMLALVGYSNNDTIIVYDRVRETAFNHPEKSIFEIVNKAINETLGRTIVTSITTFVVAGSLYVMGGAVLENFTFTLMCGVIVGTYSSIFVASSLIITITEFQRKRETKLKASGKKKRREFSVRPDPRFG